MFKRILASALGLMLILSCIPGRILAEEEPEGKGEFEKFMTANVPATFNDESNEPYGYGKDVPFVLNKQAELLFYMTNASSNNSVIYD